jgi:hypothetical protein
MASTWIWFSFVFRLPGARCTTNGSPDSNLFSSNSVNELSVNAIQETFSAGLWIAHFREFRIEFISVSLRLLLGSVAFPNKPLTDIKVWYYTKLFGIMTKIECRGYNGISSLKTLRIM